VFLPEAEDEGVTGVIGQVLTLITGAAATNGFHGIGGNHQRSGLLHYGCGDVNDMRLRRNDNGQTVEVQYNPRIVPPDSEQMTLMGLVLHGHANPAQRQHFGELRQDRVRHLLIEHADDPAVVRVRCVQPSVAT
ncbi:MAG TPA: hypothetical protein VFK31_09435, partial [Rhodanobacteraceae bacterium]|nr:hypothetical protein [Rhodanobacteraceae bacterium]